MHGLERIRFGQYCACVHVCQFHTLADQIFVIVVMKNIRGLRLRKSLVPDSTQPYYEARLRYILAFIQFGF